jgi:glycosyltransferase involved in cell wall biosynthesis
LIALNGFVANQLAQLGYSPVTVIPMWVPALARRPDPKAARERLGMGGRFLIVAFGFIGARRGYELLLQALPHLPKEALIVLAGGPHPLDRSDYYPRLMRQIAEHPQRHQIHVTGFLPDEEVDQWLAAADVIVAPFRQLSGSASLMRALAHAKPIVASDLPPLRELAEASGAMLLAPNEPTAWAEAILRLRTDEALRQQLSDAARQFAQSCTVTEAAKQHFALYQQVSRRG